MGFGLKFRTSFWYIYNLGQVLWVLSHVDMAGFFNEWEHISKPSNHFKPCTRAPFVYSCSQRRCTRLSSLFFLFFFATFLPLMVQKLSTKSFHTYLAMDFVWMFTICCKNNLKDINSLNFSSPSFLSLMGKRFPTTSNLHTYSGIDSVRIV
jgi:hypothetical protein